MIVHSSLAYSHLEGAFSVGEGLSSKKQLQCLVPASSLNVSDKCHEPFLDGCSEFFDCNDKSNLPALKKYF